VPTVTFGFECPSCAATFTGSSFKPTMSREANVWRGTDPLAELGFLDGSLDLAAYGTVILAATVRRPAFRETHSQGLSAEQRLSDLTPRQLEAFFDALDETPQRRAGGYVVGIRPLKRGEGEHRSRSAFARLERCKARLAELEARMEDDEC
jgi:hypothetical protein